MDIQYSHSHSHSFLFQCKLLIILIIHENKLKKAQKHTHYTQSILKITSKLFIDVDWMLLSEQIANECLRNGISLFYKTHAITSEILNVDLIC